ncbi:MAG: hypothetical protein LBU69_01530, partial [Deltaproteobacteria bacterium]|nr:hypothetical protein [Deltaproteobacteria bacterium]
MSAIWHICVLLAALVGTTDLGPPRPIFDPSPSPPLSSPADLSQVVPPKYPSLYGRRSDVYDRAVLFIREERFSEALALIRKQSREIREWPGIWVLEAGLLS